MSARKRNLSHLNNVPIEATVELGRVEKTLNELRHLGVNEVVELDKLAGEALVLRFNGHPFAEGEIAVAADRMAIRLTHLLEIPEE